jgi:hypothetical protein
MHLFHGQHLSRFRVQSFDVAHFPVDDIKTVRHYNTRVFIASDWLTALRSLFMTILTLLLYSFRIFSLIMACWIPSSLFTPRYLYSVCAFLFNLLNDSININVDVGGFCSLLSLLLSSSLLLLLICYFLQVSNTFDNNFKPRYKKMVHVYQSLQMCFWNISGLISKHCNKTNDVTFMKHICIPRRYTSWSKQDCNNLGSFYTGRVAQW